MEIFLGTDTSLFLGSLGVAVPLLTCQLQVCLLQLYIQDLGTLPLWTKYVHFKK